MVCKICEEFFFLIANRKLTFKCRINLMISNLFGLVYINHERLNSTIWSFLYKNIWAEKNSKMFQLPWRILEESISP